MTKQQKLEYAINTEIDVYINMLQEDMVTDKEARNLICRTVIPRFNKLKAIVLGYESEEDMFGRDILPDC